MEWLMRLIPTNKVSTGNAETMSAWSSSGTTEIPSGRDGEGTKRQGLEGDTLQVRDGKLAGGQE